MINILEKIQNRDGKQVPAPRWERQRLKKHSMHRQTENADWSYQEQTKKEQPHGAQCSSLEKSISIYAFGEHIANFENAENVITINWWKFNEYSINFELYSIKFWWMYWWKFLFLFYFVCVFFHNEIVYTQAPSNWQCFSSLFKCNFLISPIKIIEFIFIQIISGLDLIRTKKMFNPYHYTILKINELQVIMIFALFFVWKK